jgi:hypothetical protein
MATSPYTQTDTQAGVADYAMPYVQNMLGAVQNQIFNTDANGNITGLTGYTPYSQNAADYFAGFTPLQQQAQQGVANLGLPSTFGQAMGLTGQTYGNLMGLGGQAANAGMNYGMQATNPWAVQSYMNPYLQASLAPQMQLLGEQQAQQGQQLASQASQAGAFGGSRYGLQQGLQNQANQLAMSNLVGQGYNTAYNNALQNMQFGANLGLQGQQAAAGMYGQGLNAANQLANIGNQALTAQEGILGQQQQTGATQQGLQQNILNQAVQNYNTAQQYPYQQLGFMQNMLSGLPIATQSQQYYQQAPTTLQQLASLGMGAYGLNQLFGSPTNPTNPTGTATGTNTAAAGTTGITGGLNTIGSGLTNLYNQITGNASVPPPTPSGNTLPTAAQDPQGYTDPNATGSKKGGVIKGYAKGGDVNQTGQAIPDLSLMQSQGLQAALQAAQARGDTNETNAVQEQLANQSLLRQAAPKFASAEDASIAQGLGSAFNQLPQQTRTQLLAGGGIVAFADNDDQPVQQDMPATYQQGPADPRLLNLAEQRVNAVNAFIPQVATEQGVSQARQNRLNEINQQIGPNVAAQKYQQYLDQAQANQGQGLEQGKGLAALAAMQGMLQPGGFMRGLGAAGGAFAQSYGKALEADRAEKQHLALAQFNLADSVRKEQMGLMKEADAAEAAYRGNIKDANKANLDKLEHGADASVKLANASRQLKAPGSGSGPKEFEAGPAAYLPEVQELYPDLSLERQKAKAFQLYQERKSAGLEGVKTRVEASAEEKARERAAKRAYTDTELNAAIRKKDTAAADARRKAILQEEMGKSEPGKTSNNDPLGLRGK